jgi:ribosome-binding factor A
MQGARTDRVAQVVRESITEALVYGAVKDPRVADAGLITITHVKVSGDLRHAKVYLVLHAGDAAQAIEGLNAARGYLRRLVGERLRTRAIPELAFFVDEEFEHGQKMEQLFHQLESEKKP